MAQSKKSKSRVNRLGYGALALYALGMLAAAVGIYGINLSSITSRLHESERVRERMRSGNMVVVTGDRQQCRTYKFDNVTSEVTAEQMVECENALPPDGTDHSGSFDVFQRGFQSR